MLNANESIERIAIEIDDLVVLSRVYKLEQVAQLLEAAVVEALRSVQTDHGTAPRTGRSYCKLVSSDSRR